jgi:multidrug efflux pump subunit AcrA (membrane-fusion protein)
VSEHAGRAPLSIFLGLLCVAAIVVAYTTVGDASTATAQSRRTATVARGVVQSTVSGSGNLQAADELDLGFKTSGVVTRIYVKQGQHVSTGQLLAAVDPQSAEVTLEQAKASLLDAEASLATDEETDDGSSSSSASVAASSSTSTSTSSTVSSATREATLASAKAAVRSDTLTVQSDEEDVQDTKLYAPEDGTIVTLSGEVGETVSATGTTKVSSTSSSASSGESSKGSAGTSSAGASTVSSGSTSSSSFAVLSKLESMQLVVSLSESEIGNIKVGQIATVTVEALSGAKLAAHVSEVAELSTSSSGAVSYDVTFKLDQMRSGMRPGMSATAEVVIKQAEGLNVPTTAISGGSVTVLRSGKEVRQPVTSGLAGDTATIVLSGLKAGETVVLPAATSTSSAAGSSSKAAGSGSSSSGTLAGALGSSSGAAGGAPGGSAPGGGAPGGGSPP